MRRGQHGALLCESCGGDVGEGLGVFLADENERTHRDLCVPQDHNPVLVPGVGRPRGAETGFMWLASQRTGSWRRGWASGAGCAEQPRQHVLVHERLGVAKGGHRLVYHVLPRALPPRAGNPRAAPSWTFKVTQI